MPFDPSRLFARLMHYYPALDDVKLLRMPWRRRDALAREMVIAQEEERDAQEAEMARMRAEMAAQQRGTSDPYGGGSGAYGDTDAAYGDIRDTDAAAQMMAAHADVSPQQGQRSGAGSHFEQALARELPKPVAWQWDD